MSMEPTMTPSRPYLLRAFFDWLLDNELTPHLVVNVNIPHVMVPMQFVQDGQIVLNIAPRAVGQFHMDNEAVSFSARFGGVSQQLYVPMRAVLGLYARENGQGLFFDPQEYGAQPITATSETADSSDLTVEDSASQKSGKKPSLRILD